MKRWAPIVILAIVAGCSNSQEEQVKINAVASVDACAKAIPTLNDAQVRAHCDSLSEDAQRQASKIATEKDGGIVYLPPFEAKKAVADTRSSGEPVVQPTTFKEVRDLALKGDYQAQRNLAFGYTSWPYSGQDKNPILGCAWRIVILKSGSEKVDETDVGNFQVYCSKLDRESRTAAEAQAASLLKKILKD